MLANDMHLDHGVPNIWYRASLEYAGRKVTGVTLPGTPAVVAGSNGSVAWGFTNAYVDTGDLRGSRGKQCGPFCIELLGTMGTFGWRSARRPYGEGRRRLVVDYTWTIWGPLSA
jgi:penicillin amidase